MVTIIFVLLIIALVTAFSVQNALPVKVSFLIWNFEASLAIIIFLTILAGFILGVLITVILRAHKKRPV